MKLAIFDIDGTLTKTSDVDDVCFIPSLSEHFGTSDFDTDWSAYPHVSDSGILDRLSRQFLGRPPSEDESTSFESGFIARLRAQPESEFQALEGAVEMIRLLREAAGVKLAIATGCWRASAEHKLDQAGIDFSGIPMGTASDAMARVDILQFARRCAGDVDDVIYLGDAVWDVTATTELGWRLIGVGERIHELRAHGVEHVFADYSDPDKILDIIMK